MNMTNNSFPRAARTQLTCAMLTVALATSGVNAAELAQSPLFAASSAKPNFILALDDSLSMYREHVFPQGDPERVYWNPDNKSMFATDQPGILATTGLGADVRVFFASMPTASTYAPPLASFAFSRSPDFNSMYFHPATEYLPWLMADGERWPAADPQKAALDPRPGPEYWPENTYSLDLTDAEGFVPVRFEPDTGQTVTVPYSLMSGMVIPAGMPYQWYMSAEIPNPNAQWVPVPNPDNDPDLDDKFHWDPPEFLQVSTCTEGDLTPFVAGQWLESDIDIVVDAVDANANGIDDDSCFAFLRSFPATFHLIDPSSLPGDYGYVAPAFEVPAAFGPGSGSLWRYEIRPENFSSTSHYEKAIGNFANWFQYHRNRFLAVVASTTEALADVENVRLGTFKINDRLQVDMRDLSLAPERGLVYEQLTSLQSTAKLKNDPFGTTFGNTPNRDAVAHIGEQFRRTDAEAPIEKSCQINSGMLFTDGYTSKLTGPTGYGNADGGLDPPFRDAYPNTMADIVTSYFDGARTPLRTDAGFAPGLVPVAADCTGADPDPRLDCETNLHMQFSAVAFGPQGAIYGVDQAATVDPFVSLPDWDSLGAPQSTGGAVVIDELWHATINGRGTFVNARKPADVTKAIESALKEATVDASNTGGIAGSGSRRDAGFLGYVPHFNAGDWTGDLTAHATGLDGQFSAQVWSAALSLEQTQPSARKIFFSDAGDSLKPFDVANLGGEQAAVERLGFDPSADYWRPIEDMLANLRGDHSNEQKNSGGTLRDRTSRLGDILGSQPEVLTSAGFGYTGLPPEQGGGASGPGSYGEFLQTTKKTRTTVAFVGANDGMLHAFDASVGATGGQELFAIVPASVMSNMGKLPDPAYQHHYFVDGSPVQGDAWDGAWKTVLLAPMGAGGKSIVALDVTDPANGFGPDRFLWEFTDPDLQETLSKPSIVMLRGGQWVAIFGGGIDRTPASAGKATLFIVDLFSGKLLQKIFLPPPSNLNQLEQNGVIAYVPVDVDYDLRVDTIYVADYDAQLWRLDVDAQGKVSIGNGGQRVFRAMDRNGRPLVVTGGMDSFPHHIRGQMVFFGTGRYLFEDEDEKPNPGLTQAFFGVWDDPDNPTSFERASLKTQHILEESNVDGTPSRRLTNEAVDWSTQRGWVIDLALKDVPNTEAELAIGEPVVALGRVTFTTFSPAAGDTCTGGGLNRLYSVSATSGVGELAFHGGGEGSDVYGSIEIPASSASGPILTPALVTSPPPPACVPGSEGCPLPPDDEEGGVFAVPSAGCKTALGVLLGDGLLNFDSLTCGRQSWQQRL